MNRTLSILSLLCLLLAATTPALGASLVDVELTAAGPVFDARLADHGLVLVVAGPQDFTLRRAFAPGEDPALGVAGLADGLYKWELRALPVVSAATRAALERARESGDTAIVDRLRAAGELPAARAPQHGAFTVRGGAVLTVADSAPEPAATGAATASPDERARQERMTSTADGAMTHLSAADTVFIDDVIVSANLCAGTACLNNESFGSDVLRLKDVNNRVHFWDTSGGTFPTRDWRITVNEDTNGGLTHFSIDDIDGGATPFRIEGGAPDSGLYLDDSGRLGLGTSTPVEEIHSVRGDTPTIRLEQDGSSAFTPQTWDILGNEAGFAIRDVTGGSDLPLRIRPGAPEDSLHILADGDVALGAPSPPSDVRLFIRADTSSNFAGLQVLNLGTGNIQTRFAGSGWEWRQTFRSGDLIFDSQEDGANEWEVDTAGNVTATSFNPTSDRALKTGFAPVDGGEILDRLAEIPITRWSYREDTAGTPHIGPVAQDFHAAFGVGADDKHISTTDADGVAFAAIQALNQRLLSAVEKLEARNAELEARLAALEAEP